MTTTRTDQDSRNAGIGTGLVAMNEILSLIPQGALFAVNNSGGKDSQAMMALIRDLVPPSQILVIHAELPGEDWPGTLQHAKEISQGLEFRATRSVKTFMDMVDHRQMFPSPQYRQCTSDLKRGPLYKVIRQYANENGFDKVVNCMGIRAEESAARAKAQPFKINKKLTTKSRQAWDWLPIHEYLVDDVFAEIRSRGQEPHWVYSKGMNRLSCMFCIMASKEDLQIAARLNPQDYAKFVDKEKEINFTMNMKGIPLEEITGIPVKSLTNKRSQ